MNDAIQRMITEFLQLINESNVSTPEDDQTKELLHRVNKSNLAGLYDDPNNSGPYNEEQALSILKSIKNQYLYRKTGLFEEDPNKPIVIWEPVSPLLASVEVFHSVEFKLRYDGTFVEDMKSGNCSEDVFDFESVNMQDAKPILSNRIHWQELEVTVSCQTGNRRLTNDGRFWEYETALVLLTFLNVAFVEFCQFEFYNTSMVSNELNKLYNLRYNLKAIRSNASIQVEHDVSSVGRFGLWKLENLPIGITKVEDRIFDEYDDTAMPKGPLTLYEIDGDELGSFYIVASEVLVEILNPGSYKQ